MTDRPGPEMDRLIAERVMGIDLGAICDGEMWNEDTQYWSCMKCWKKGDWHEDFTHEIVPLPYSTSITAAWVVVLHLLEYAYTFEISFEGFGWHCRFDPDPLAPIIEANTAPLAICRAALKAVEVC